MISTAALVTLSAPALASDMANNLVAPDHVYNAGRDRQDAQLASLKGDWASEVVFAGKAYREDPTLLNEFNLAVGYEALGRTTLAIPLYQDLSARGQRVRVEAVYNYDRPIYAGEHVRHIDPTIGGEADRRLNQIAGRPAPFTR